MPFPSIEELLTTTPLYEELEIDDEGLKTLDNIALDSPRINAYCPRCGQDRVFQVKQLSESCAIMHSPQGRLNLTLGRVIKTNNLNCLLSCALHPEHIISANFIFLGKKLIKTGQYPSIAETTIPEYKKYKAVLNEEKHKELIRGIGLISHGVGIGAFVYLRRIFEYLIEEAHHKAKDDNGWDESAFLQNRMGEKIELLKLHLPQFLVENRKLYAILSKGVHELSENECLQYFDIVKLGVELILDEKLEKHKTETKTKLAKESLTKLNSILSKEGTS